MRLSVIGTGYVGLVTGCGLAKVGHDVVCVDIDEKKVEMINKGRSPIYEKGLEEALLEVVGKRLRATSDLKSAVRDSEIIFITVGTPSAADGSVDLSFVRKAFLDVLGFLDSHKVIVVKSTVVPGSTDSLAKLGEEKTRKKAGKDYGLCMNPEFLREGRALEDFLHPDRIVIGADDAKTMEKMLELYSSFDCPKVKVDRKTAEMIKYASNSFLATKVSFMNEIGNICKKSGVDVYAVLEGMKYDGRIGEKFMNAGAGFGGSCLPKDVSALIHYSKQNGYEPKILEAVVETNKGQPLRMLEIAKKRVGLAGKKVAVLGLAFKPDTDDVRESPALRLISLLLKEKAPVSVYDPKAMDNARKVLGDAVRYARDAKDALNGADVCFLMTEWEEFKNPGLYRDMLLVDGRNSIRKSEKYEGICW